MKRNVTLIARRGAQAALFSYLRNASQASSRIGLDFLNPSHNTPTRCERFHSTIHTQQNGKSTCHGLVSFFDDTIYAVSTAPGRAGIAIIRVSGTGSLDVSDSVPLFSLFIVLTVIGISCIMPLESNPQTPLRHATDSVRTKYLQEPQSERPRLRCARPALPITENRHWRRNAGASHPWWPCNSESRFISNLMLQINLYNPLC